MPFLRNVRILRVLKDYIAPVFRLKGVSIATFGDEIGFVFSFWVMCCVWDGVKSVEKLEKVRAFRRILRKSREKLMKDGEK